VLQASLTMIVLPLAWQLTSALGPGGTAAAWTVGQAAVAVIAVFLTRDLLRQDERPPELRPHRPLADAMRRRGTS
jgi:hypothetical protein